PARLDAIGLGFPADVVVERCRAIDEWQIVIVELREPAEIGEVAPSLDREVVGQRGRDDRSLLDLDPVVRAVDDGVTAREWIDTCRNAELAGAKLEVRLVLSGIRAHGIDDEADRRIEL